MKHFSNDRIPLFQVTASESKTGRRPIPPPDRVDTAFRVADSIGVVKGLFVALQILGAIFYMSVSVPAGLTVAAAAVMTWVVFSFGQHALAMLATIARNSPRSRTGA